MGWGSGYCCYYYCCHLLCRMVMACHELCKDLHPWPLSLSSPSDWSWQNTICPAGHKSCWISASLVSGCMEEEPTNHENSRNWSLQFPLKSPGYLGGSRSSSWWFIARFWESFNILLKNSWCDIKGCHFHAGGLVAPTSHIRSTLNQLTWF